MTALRAQVASAIDVVVHTARLTDGSRKIVAISEVLGLQDGEYMLNDLYAFKLKGIAPDGSISGVFGGCGNQPTFLREAALMGITLNQTMFEESASDAT